MSVMDSSDVRTGKTAPRPCMDCGKIAQPHEKACAHCGGRLSRVARHGVLGTLVAVAAVAKWPVASAVARLQRRRRLDFPSRH